MVKNFLKIVLGGFGGGICGVMIGFILSLLIAGLVTFNCWILGGCQLPDEGGMPTQMITVFSTGAGAVIGGIFGAIFALRKQKE